ncbi:peptide/nickel transport system permease protein [Orenia metallireducens]|uniref:Peptide/nickel transport system permease protein n=1 Tax=Orenia metallireducens TaxID=1413210 RepID=A0A285G2J6_9FIRM|nr:ABC transporter permease [Orenia metallireducens]PRX31792.1 peptide/nickel transport system permease protein [Orenia metallireducens]SNY17304.1 peptide/nickel transport system permease protein [Orenia metallireducens]
MISKYLIVLLGFNLLTLIFSLSKATNNQDNLISYLIFALLTLALGFLINKVRKTNQTDSNIQTTSNLTWKKLKRNKNAVFGLIIIIILVYISILAPFIMPHDPLEMNWGKTIQKPSLEHWFGTDEFGRDIFSRAIYGVRIALGIGLLAVVLNTLLGTFLGLIAGYYGGRVDNLIMRAIEMWNSIPFILMAIALIAALGTGLLNLILVVSITGIMQFARVIRSSVLGLKKADYVLAAKVMGIPDRQIIIRHILPNCIAPIIVLATLRIGEMILTIAGLSFLGLGIQPPMPALGSMLSSGQQYISENLMMSIVPGTMILLIVFAFNLLGDGLRDALDSKLSN